MNTLSNISKQIGDLLASMTPQARVMAGLMFGVIVLSLGWILTTSQSGNMSYILGYQPLSPEEIRQAEKAFGSASLGDYDIVGSRIKVPTADKAAYLKALADSSALPERWDDEIKKSLEVGIFDPPSLTNMRHRESRSHALGQVLKQLPQVDFAAVMMDEKSEGFARETKKVCSISVRQEGNIAIDQSILGKVAELATKTIAGLKKEDVAVFDLGSGALYRATDDAMGGDDNLILKAAKKWEDHFTQKVHTLLGHIDMLKVMVNVELDHTLSTESEVLSYEPTGVTTQASSSRSDTESTKSPRGGQPGAGPNAISNQPQVLSASNSETRQKVKESEESTQNQYGTEAKITKELGLYPEELSITVALPESYFHKKWLQRQVLEKKVDANGQPSNPPDPAEISAIKAETIADVENQLSTMAVGIRSGQNRDAFFQVTSYTDFPLPEPPEITMSETAVDWLAESWSTLAMIGLVLVSLGMMFNWVRSQQVDEETEKRFAEGFGIEVPEPPEDELDLSGTAEATTFDENGNPVPGPAKSGLEPTGQDVKDDLSNLIKENPEAAANLLKTWIGEAA